MRITTWGQGGYRASRAAPMQSCGHKWLEVGCNIAWMGKHWRLLLKKTAVSFSDSKIAVDLS